MLGEFVRESLKKLDINDTVSFPRSNSTTVLNQMQDLKMFDDYLFTSKVDKTRNEITVKRLK